LSATAASFRSGEPAAARAPDVPPDARSAGIAGLRPDAVCPYGPCRFITGRLCTRALTTKLRRVHVTCLVLLLLFLSGCTGDSTRLRDLLPGSAGAPEITAPDSIVYTGRSSQIVISAVGDIMMHGPQIRAQLDPLTGNYSFVNNFRWVRSYLLLSDLAIGNLETTLGRPNGPFTGYPAFNSPDALARDLQRSGFDVLVTANNHSMDTGTAGLRRTASRVESYGMVAAGTRTARTDSTWNRFTIRDITVAFAAWTYESEPHQNRRTINGIPIPVGQEYLINSYNPANTTADLSRMASQITEMRASGADLLIFYMHWGEEYADEPTPAQQELASWLAGQGVDIIFGTHPHVVQAVEFLDETLVVWSMGNFLSNQRYESLRNRDTEDGIMVHVLVSKDHEQNQTTVTEVHVMPTWVHRYWQGGADGRLVYEILPAANVVADPDYFGIQDDALLERIGASLDRTRQTIFP